MRGYESKLDKAINILGEHVYDLEQENKRDKTQRRVETVDLYGVPFTTDADGGAPATFWISLSPDMIYMERFAFKLIIEPFTATVGGGGATQSAEVSISNTSLSVSNNQITPNPHNHEATPHSHNIVTGITKVNTDAHDFRVAIDGVDITAYLMAQQGGRWISGEGIYPDTSLGNERNLYDVQRVINDLRRMGHIEEGDKIRSSGFKKMTISSAKPFRTTMYLYLKYNYNNR